ncbi:hypothetical protein [uncultured Acinetobacter sp.]|uniref:hypothetical protein n=1 Tax=uncultured Acinetobacter sp. TaxID=165433 RepID=UPI002627F604|nr:hypothetical protein [uncultured Acinetobacter sp.]
MLLYVLPFIILLVVAIVLKKRQDNQKAEPTKKTTAAKAKTVSTPSTEVVETPVVVQAVAKAVGSQERTPLAPELRRHIENQMRDGNYFAAEAQINQALNRDNAQHELYLMLLDLHLLQNDEFAINQLFTHLRSLQLDDIVQQAQDKRVAHEARLVEEAKTKAESQAAKLAVSSLSFDQLQQEEVKPAAQAPLEFAPKAEVAPATDVAKPLDFAVTSNTTEKTEPTPLEFNAAPVAKPVQDEVKPLDFAFTLDQSAAPVEPVVESKEPQALEFSLDQTPSTQKSELEFNLETAPTQPAKAELEFSLDNAAKAKPEQALEFNLEPSKAEKTEFDFNLEQPTPAPLDVPVAKVEPQSFDFKFEAPTEVAAVAEAAVNTQDPLLQLFPELAQLSEIDLNLKLAAEYVRLGAHSDAISVLAEHEASYNDQQREFAQSLRNKIA